MPTHPDSQSDSTGVGAGKKPGATVQRAEGHHRIDDRAAADFGVAALFMAHAWTRESTDDAFVDANIVFIAPRVPGNVIALHVNDNQLVSQGDPLFEIDPSEISGDRQLG